jgi:D-lactate dehydrogenase
VDGNGGFPDRVPDELAGGTPEPLRRELEGLLGERQVLGRAIDIVSYASDASPYRMLPKAVVRPRGAEDVAGLLEWARRSGRPLTFRAGGTSLNGQSQSDSILVDVRHHFAGTEIEEDGRRARVKPGTILGHANRVLAPFGRKLGPDPASTDIATVGGVIANNSGGMRCGVVADSYSTVRELTFVLPSGTVIDTADPDAGALFGEREPELAESLAAIRDEIRADAELSERIRAKFRIKNTTGYRLCAFLDADEPVEIFRRLLVGSEGTLAFIAEAVFETVPVPARTTVSWLHFDGIEAAVAPVPDFVAAGATAVELMVAPSLIVASHSIPGTPVEWRDLPPESAVLLVEFGADDDAGLDALEAKAAEVLGSHTLIQPADWTRDNERVELAWSVREGMHGLVGRLRPPGTALIVEDVCVPPERIAEGARDVQALLQKHGFLPGVAGHASAGNLHFMLTPQFSEQADRERYEAFMGDLVDLIVDEYDGSLKAEHGTGVNMAPFVEREWGEKATELMWRVKRLADPDGVLAPGVLLNRDPDAHLHNLKSVPAIHEDVTTCVECGFCEPACPSRLLTTTPRQRIVLLRELARQPAGSPLHKALLEEFEYDGVQTCAADGTCALACPLGIDTGKVVKELRAQERTARAEAMGLRAARHWGAQETAARALLRTGRAIGDGPMRGLSRLARRVASTELVPEWVPPMPPPAPRLPETSREGAAAVYFPACINRIFAAPDGGSLPAALVEVSARAGLPLWIPPDVVGHCCGVPWSSKGFRRGHEHMTAKLADSLGHWTEGGELPVVIDASSCTHGFAEALGADYEVIDSVAWASERLLPELEIARRIGSMAVHPTCSTRHMGLTRSLEGLASALAEEVVVPRRATCCGFAGDRGFLHPELTEAATQEEAAEIAGRRFDAHVSSNRTCELGLERATGRPYTSIVHLLEELTR